MRLSDRFTKLIAQIFFGTVLHLDKYFAVSPDVLVRRGSGRPNSTYRDSQKLTLMGFMCLASFPYTHFCEIDSTPFGLAESPTVSTHRFVSVRNSHLTMDRRYLLSLKCPDFPLFRVSLDTMCSVIVMLYLVWGFKPVYYFYTNETLRCLVESNHPNVRFAGGCLTDWLRHLIRGQQHLCPAWKLLNKIYPIEPLYRLARYCPVYKTGTSLSML